MRHGEWELSGKYYESCRMEGHCPLWFGRNLWGERGCVNFETWEIVTGHIGVVDVSGIIIVRHQDGIGPKAADLGKPGGISEGAVYVSDNASEEQRKVLTPFVKNNMGMELWGKNLGTKFVQIKVNHGNGTHHTWMPFGEQQITLTVGGDGKAPIEMANPINTSLRNVAFGNTDVWSYHDYGKNIVCHNTGGTVGDFHIKGTLS
jgi:hypothetical protein